MATDCIAHIPLSHNRNQRAFKIILIGNANVGKTSLIQRYEEGYFHDSSNHKVLKHDYIEKDIIIQGVQYKFEVWDTAGQERYRSVTRSLYHGVKGVILVYDVTNYDSYVELQSWLKEVRDNFEPESHTCFFLANKSDKEPKDQTIPFSQLSSDPLFLEFPHKYETSALTGRNVNLVFDKLQKEIVRKSSEDVDEQYADIVNKLEYNPTGCAC